MNRHAALESEGDPKEEVARHEKADLLEVMDPLVLHHEVEESGEVREGYEHEIEPEPEEGMCEHPHHPAVEKISKTG